MSQHIAQMSLGELLTFYTKVSELYISIKPTDLCMLHSSNNCGHDVKNCMETELKGFFFVFLIPEKQNCPSTYFRSGIVKQAHTGHTLLNCSCEPSCNLRSSDDGL